MTLLFAAGALSLSAQNSFPAPGAGSRPGGGGMPGGNSFPAPGGGGFNGGPAPGQGPGRPGPSGGPGWGGPWGPSWNAPIIINTPLSSPGWQNSGVTSVVGCGYDAQGVWRTIPMKVAYNYNGVQYNVTVLNAWNPWTDMWSIGVDSPAFNTSYYLNGTTFNFYTVLSTGTYYFNL